MCFSSLIGFQELNWRHDFLLSPPKRSSVMLIMIKTTTNGAFRMKLMQDLKKLINKIK